MALGVSSDPGIKEAQENDRAVLLGIRSSSTDHRFSFDLCRAGVGRLRRCLAVSDSASAGSVR
jgi:hypothetical protein